MCSMCRQGGPAGHGRGGPAWADPGEQGRPGLVKAATFDQMRVAADRIQPYGGSDNSRDNSAFFGAGRSGSGTELLTAAELADYRARVAKALPPDLMAWLHRSGSLAKVLSSRTR